MANDENVEAPGWISEAKGSSFTLAISTNPKVYFNGWAIQRRSGDVEVWAPDGSMAVIDGDDLASRAVRAILDAVARSFGLGAHAQDCDETRADCSEAAAANHA